MTKQRHKKSQSKKRDPTYSSFLLLFIILNQFVTLISPFVPEVSHWLREERALKIQKAVDSQNRMIRIIEATTGVANKIEDILNFCERNKDIADTSEFKKEKKQLLVEKDKLKAELGVVMWEEREFIRYPLYDAARSFNQWDSTIENYCLAESIKTRKTIHYFKTKISNIVRSYSHTI